MYSCQDLRKGLKIQINNQPWLIFEFEFRKPGKGTALYRCRMRNLITGNTQEITYRPSDKIEKPDLENREMFYSYPEGDSFVFSDSETYEETRVQKDKLGQKQYFLLPDAQCEILFFNGEAIDIELPIFIEKEITETEPGLRGDTATNVLKPAKIDNGYEMNVPIFINEGDVIKIDTRTGEYVERISKA